VNRSHTSFMKAPISPRAVTRALNSKRFQGPGREEGTGKETGGGSEVPPPPLPLVAA